jgi:hypothetical protein
VTAGARPLSVLLLADYEPFHANTTLEHIEALRDLSHHNVRIFNPRALVWSVALDLDEFDVVVIHYTIMAISDHYLSPSFRAKLRRFKGLKVQLIQDDYRQVNAFHALIRNLGITVLFTLVPEPEIEKVWPASALPGVEKITVLAGYAALDAGWRPVPPLADRPYDIVYRGRVTGFWLGRLAQEKAWIAQGVEQRAAQYGLEIDVDWREGARIYGNDWHAFLSSGRATLGAESGATITDFDGSIERRTIEYLAKRPEATFEEVHREILAPYEGNVMMNVVSPRVFEAIAARTALVLFPGYYSGVVEPERHYIPLEKDFSNFAEVRERLRDLPALERMAERAYQDVIASQRYSIGTLVERFDRALDEHGTRRQRPRAAYRYQLAEVERPIMLRLHGWQQPVRTFKYRLMVEVGARIRVVFDALNKVLLTFFLAAARPAIRALLIRYFSHTASERVAIAPPRAVLEDLLKLALVDRLRSGSLPGGGHAPSGLTVRADRIGDDLVLRSVPATIPPLDDVANGGASRPPVPDHTELPSRVLWDHSAVGRAVAYRVGARRAVRVAIGEPGNEVHEFATFPALASHFPDEVADAIALATGDAK